MKSMWSNLLIPAAALALALGSLPSREGRESLRHAEGAYILFHSRDTVTSDTLKAPVPSSDFFEDEDDSLFFDMDRSPADTIPAITARDTMKVPDSLRFTNPFLYKWYVATKDSLTHRIVVDSLKQAGDSTDWVIIDSIYLADSTAAAIEAFNKWYASLSKAERKRYEYQKKLPALLHRQDSILQRKDSIRQRRDSIIQNTPRILETGYIPDSMQYKRFISWMHETRFNEITLFDWDTTFNYQYHDYPHLREDINAASLGMAGSAVQTFDFSLRKEKEGVSFYEPYASWTYTPSTLPMYNTKTPYTELQYTGTLLSTQSKEADNIRLFTTQNILPQLNVALEFKQYGGAGILKNEKTMNNTAVVSGNWLGKRYIAHGGWIRNKIARTENGGIRDVSWIRDTTVDAREIEVWLSSASNQYKKTTLFFDQSYKIPFTFIQRLSDLREVRAEKAHRDSIIAYGDSADAAAAHRWFNRRQQKREEYYSSLDTMANLTTAFVGSSSEYSVYNKLYQDAISSSDTYGSQFYNGKFYINPSKSRDSLRMMRLENRVFVQIQPWSPDGPVSRIEGGLGDRVKSFYMYNPGNALTKSSHTVWNTAYAYAGARGRLFGVMDWNALGEYAFLGHEANDMLLKANASLCLHPFRRYKNSPMHITATVETSLREPDYFQQNFYSNHYRWSGNFGKISTSLIKGSIDIPRWKFGANAWYTLLSGNIWYDTEGIARQNASAMSVLGAGIRKDFVINDLFHLDNRFLLQYSSNQEVVPLPLLSMNLRYYIQFNIVNANVMKMQLGLDTRFNTLWYAPAFNPVTGTFMAQNAQQYGNCPIADVFMNIQWKRACVFVKYENVAQGWPMDKKDYFSAHGYINTQSVLKIGIWWPFYVMSGTNKTMSSRAGSGMGGGSGLGGGLGGMMGGLKGR